MAGPTRDSFEPAPYIQLERGPPPARGRVPRRHGPAGSNAHLCLRRPPGETGLKRRRCGECLDNQEQFKHRLARDICQTTFVYTNMGGRERA